MPHQKHCVQPLLPMACGLANTRRGWKAGPCEGAKAPDDDAAAWPTAGTWRLGGGCETRLARKDCAQIAANTPYLVFQRRGKRRKKFREDERGRRDWRDRDGSILSSTVSWMGG